MAPKRTGGVVPDTSGYPRCTPPCLAGEQCLLDVSGISQPLETNLVSDAGYHVRKTTLYRTDVDLPGAEVLRPDPI